MNFIWIPVLAKSYALLRQKAIEANFLEFAHLSMCFISSFQYLSKYTRNGGSRLARIIISSITKQLDPQMIGVRNIG